MKKTILFLGLATMICATPVMAATTKATTPVAALHAHEMCMIHGKKTACAKQATHAKHGQAKVQVAAKKK